MESILITGAFSGIGRATYEALDRSKYTQIILLDKQELVDLPEKVLFYKCDLHNPEDLEKVFSDLDQRGICLTKAVNAAGIPGPNKAFSETDLGDVQKVFAVNFFGNFLLLKHELASMEKSGKGSVLSVASVLARCGMPGSSSYAASKAALVAMTKSLAIEYAPKNIQLNTISPGAVDTAFISQLKDRVGEENIKALHPSMRYATAKEIAAYIKFLMEENTSFMTGADLVVDGGYSAR